MNAYRSALGVKGGRDGGRAPGRRRFVAVWALLWLLSAGCAGAAAPKLTCPESEYNFGTAINTKPVTHTFVLKNEGDAPLKIANVRTSCGCTAANLAAQELAPGATTDLKVELSLANKTGALHKTISVSSNDPGTPVLTLELKGTAIALIEVTPRSIIWTDLSRDDVSAQSVEVETKVPDLAFQITGVDCSQPTLTAEIEPLEAGRKYRVTVRTKPPLPIGHLSANILIHTNHPEYSTIAVPLGGRVAGDLGVMPEAIDVPAPGTQEGLVNRFIRIVPEKVKTFNILEVQTPDPSIQAVVTKQSGGIVVIQLNDIKPALDLNGKVVTVKTDVPSLAEIKIPFKVRAPLPGVKLQPTPAAPAPQSPATGPK